MPRMTRRGFLQRSGVSATGLALGAGALTAAGAGRVLGANERINVALIGCGGRGRYVMYGLAEQGARITTLCDLLDSRLNETAEFLKKVQDAPARPVKDMQAVFDAKDVDAVIVATPDHWHAPATIRACRAGKDVYVEKPHCHNIWESGRMVAAARKYQRIVQVGTQNRSGPYNLQALETIQSGKMGKICLVKVFNMKNGQAFKLGEPGSPPDGFNWDAWLGRAPDRPYHQRLVRSGWQFFWDFCGGDMGNDGIHQIDLALMLMGDPGWPKSVRSLGGRYCYRGDDAQVPDVQNVSYDFPDFVMTFELTGYPRYMEKTTATIRRNDEHPYWTQNATRIELYGSELMMILGRHGGGYTVMTSAGKEIEKVFGRPCDEPHYQNFLECVRSRKPPSADVAVAHKTGVTMHMGNIAHRAGNTALAWDAEACRFDKDEANRLIKPSYRAGYEIPEEV